MLLNLVKAYYLAPVRIALKLIKWALIVAVVLGIIFALTFNLNSFKDVIETQASQALQDKFRIRGDIKLGVESFRPSLVLHDVQIGEDGRTTVILTDRLEITIPLGKPSSDEPFSLFADINNIRIDGRALGDYDIPVHFSPGGFDMPDIRGELDGAELSGKISLRENRLNVDITVKDLEYAHIAEGVKGDNVRAEIKLTAEGKNLDAWRRSLHGRVLLTGGKGTMAGDALNFWAGDLFSSILRGPAGETELSCAVADFTVESGVARSRAIIIDTPQVTISGKGSVDLVKEYVHIRFDPKPKKPALVSLATPVIVSGKFGAIAAEPEPKALAKKLGGLMLGAINPAAALLPLMEEGAGNREPCQQYKP